METFDLRKAENRPREQDAVDNDAMSNQYEVCGSLGIGITTRDRWEDLAVTLSKLNANGYGAV